MQTAALVDRADVEAFRRDGFVHLKGLLGAEEIGRLGRAVDAAVTARTRNDARALADKSPYEQSFIQCQYLWEDFPDVRPLTFHPKVVGAAAALIGAEAMRLWHDQALYKEAGGRETDAHQDHPYWPINELRTLTAWIPLIEVDDETGCMGYAPGSHTGEAEYVDIFTAPGSGEALVAKQKRKPVFVPARPGDVLFHSMFHAHCDRFGSRGAEILNLLLPDAAAPKFGAARVHDPDRVARLAESDATAARSCLYEQLLPIAPENNGWPDMLAAELLADANLRLDLWAERQGLVPETLSRGFGALYGVTPAAFRVEARAHHAFERIVYGRQPLSDIALSLGFSDQSHMTRALTSLTGKPPRHWREASNSFKTRQSSSS